MNVNSSIPSLPPAPTTFVNPQPLRKRDNEEWKVRFNSFFKNLQAEFSRSFDTLGKKTISAIARTSSTMRGVVSGCLGKTVQKINGTDASLPIDPELIYKRLDNGFTYYVRHNAYPFTQKAYLRLVLRVGFLNETKNERGIAHMIEHISQNETEHFARDEIDKYLDSKGVTWGGDNTAYTGFRETVYTLNIPVEDPEALEKSLFILSEVASRATLSNSIIEKERDIVKDELRLSRNISSRYQRKFFPVLLEGTPYPDFLDTEFEIKNINDCTPEVIRQFYKRWYVPQNMAVIAVGDIDPTETSKLIEKYFEKLPPSKSIPSEHNYYPTSHKEMRFVCFSDPEATKCEIGIFHRLPMIKKSDTLFFKNIKQSVITLFFNVMVNARLHEISELENSSFTKPKGSKVTVIPGVNYFTLTAVPKNEDMRKACKQLFSERRRIKEGGFSESEFENAKKTIHTAFTHLVQEKDKTPSDSLIELYRSHFIDHTPAPNLFTLLTMENKFFDEISLKEVNAWASKVLIEENCVTVTVSPKKSEMDEITEQDLKEVVREVKKEPFVPFMHTIVDRPLLPTLPNPGKITEIINHKESEVVEYTLENGLKIFVKATSFKNDHVTLYGYSIRGTRDASLENRVSAKFGDDFFAKCGLGDFDLMSLKKVLNGKGVSLVTSLGTYLTEIKSNAVKKDLETAFQLFHLMFVNPGYNKAAFDKALMETEEALRNRHNNPLAVFNDEIIATNTQNHPEFKPVTLEDLKQIDYETTKNFHQQSFSNPADFRIVIVGNIDHENIKILIEKYLASLSQKGERRTHFTYSDVPFPKGIIRKDVYAGKESACISYLTFPAPISDDYQERLLSSWCCEFIQTRLLEVLRKKMGKTYTPCSNFIHTEIPHLNPGCPSRAIIKISCDSAHLEEVETALLKELHNLQTEGPSENEIKDFKTSTLLSNRQNLQTNKGWLKAIVASSLWQMDLEEFDMKLDTLDCEVIKKQLQRIFPLDNYTMITLHPKKES